MPLSSRLPAPLLTRFSLPVPLPWALSRITPAKLQSVELLTVSVLSLFRPLLSKSPSITAWLLPLKPATVCTWPFSSSRALAVDVLKVSVAEGSIWLSPLSCKIVLLPSPISLKVRL